MNETVTDSTRRRPTRKRYVGRFQGVCFVLTPAQIAGVRLAAKLEGTSRSRIVRRAVAAFLGLQDVPPRLPVD